MTGLNTFYRALCLAGLFALTTACGSGGGSSSGSTATTGMLDVDGSEPTDLDVCRGHSDDGRGYHYHAASAAENMFIGCFAGEQGSIQ